MRVVVADDHPLFREALRLRLERVLEAAEIFEVGTLDELLRLLLRGSNFDLILVDLWMPGLGPGAAIESLLDACADNPVVLMSGAATAADVKHAIDLGCRGFLPKTMSPKQLDAAVSILATGGTYLPAEILVEAAEITAVSRDGGTNLRQLISDTLTPREYQVLLRLMSGSSNKEIGRELSLAEVTVKLHVRQILRKINARNRSEAASIATRAGIA